MLEMYSMSTRIGKKKEKKVPNIKSKKKKKKAVHIDEGKIN